MACMLNNFQAQPSQFRERTIKEVGSIEFNHQCSINHSNTSLIQRTILTLWMTSQITIRTLILPQINSGIVHPINHWLRMLDGNLLLILKRRQTLLRVWSLLLELEIQALRLFNSSKKSINVLLIGWVGYLCLFMQRINA